MCEASQSLVVRPRTNAKRGNRQTERETGSLDEPARCRSISRVSANTSHLWRERGRSGELTVCFLFEFYAFTATMADQLTRSNNEEASVQLTECDIPGASLSEPMASHTVPQLRWWLLCRDIRVPTSWKKQKLLSRLVSFVA